MSERRKQCRELAAYLEKNQVITPMVALTNLGIYRLAARIFDLRQQGYNIVTAATKPHAIYRLVSRYEH